MASLTYTHEALTALISRLEADIEQLVLADQLHVNWPSQEDFEALVTASNLIAPVAQYAGSEVQEFRESARPLRGIACG